MDIRLRWVESIKRPDADWFGKFAQLMVNRLLVGWVRYGFDRKFRYMTCLEKEVKAYRRTGNAEHLVNAANYAYMEYYKPENPKNHHDNTVGSVTRGKVR